LDKSKLHVFLKTTSLTAILSSLSFAVAAISADQDMFDVYPLKVNGEICNFIEGDFNGDALSDIGLVFSPSDSAELRLLSIYIQRPEKSFSAVPDRSIPLPPAAGQINAGDIDGDNIEEIVLIDSEGVLKYKYAPNPTSEEFVRIIRETTIYSLPLFRGIIVAPFIFEVLASVGRELIIPTLKGYNVYSPDGGGMFRSIGNLMTAPKCLNGGKGLRDFVDPAKSSFSVCLGSVVVSDGDQDGRQDIYLLYDRKLFCFTQGQTGDFAESAAWQIDFCSDCEDVFVQSRLVDLNDDNRLDLAASCAEGGITRAETKLRVHLAGGDGRISEKHGKEISLSDSHCNLMAGDVNNDRVREIIAPAVELGLIAVTKMILMKKADLHLLIYSLTGGLPENEPIARPRFEFQFNFDLVNPLQDVAMDWTGDYNGDNLPDLAFSDGFGRLRFFWGRINDFLSKKPDIEIVLEHPVGVYPLHLSGGGFSDLVVEHDSGGKWDQLTVLLNRNNKL
jgi:hypothetical protein